MADDKGRLVHELDVTLWIGEDIEAAAAELGRQLEHHDAVKARVNTTGEKHGTVEEIAVELSSSVDASVNDTRGNTIVFTS